MSHLFDIAIIRFIKGLCIKGCTTDILIRKLGLNFLKVTTPESLFSSVLGIIVISCGQLLSHLERTLYSPQIIFFQVPFRHSLDFFQLSVSLDVDEAS